LHDSFKNFYNLAKARAKGRRVFVGIGGDSVDGVLHHDSTQTWGTTNDQRSMAIELFRPIVGLADDALGILGTDAHVGDQGDDDAAIYEALHMDYAPVFKLDIDGRCLWWAHDGIPIGRRDHLEENAAITMIRDIQARCRRRGERAPDAIVGHDKHITFEPPMIRGTTIAICPCWQLSTSYGYNNWPYVEPTIGGLIWDLPSNRIERIVYGQTQAVRRVGH
jgi:hypothetical protein